MNRTFKTIWVVFLQEARAYFVVPIAYIYVAIFVILASILTFTTGRFFEIGEASLSFSFFRWHPLLYAFLVPAIGMRIWTLEKQQGTLELLFAQPVPLWTIVVGKYLAATFLVGLGLASTFVTLLTVSYLGNPDYGELFSGYLGSFLTAATFLAISNFCSAIFQGQVTTYILSATLCVGTILLGSSQVENEILNLFPRSRALVDTISSLSLNQYYASFRSGLIEIQALVYYLLIITLSLLATTFMLRKRQEP